jgi:serine acetyltransferase
VIGMGSVVMCDVPDDMAAVGNPSRIIRRILHANRLREVGQSREIYTEPKALT